LTLLFAWLALASAALLVLGTAATVMGMRMFGFFRLAPLILKYFPLKRSSGLVQSNLKTLRPSSSNDIRSPVLG
jgi:hypothetical protein